MSPDLFRTAVPGLRVSAADASCAYDADDDVDEKNDEHQRDQEDRRVGVPNLAHEDRGHGCRNRQKHHIQHVSDAGCDVGRVGLGHLDTRKVPRSGKHADDDQGRKQDKQYAGQCKDGIAAAVAVDLAENPELRRDLLGKAVMRGRSVYEHADDCDQADGIHDDIYPFSVRLLSPVFPLNENTSPGLIIEPVILCIATVIFIFPAHVLPE